MAELLAPFGPIPRFNSRTNSQTIVDSSFPMPSGRLRGPTRAPAHPGRSPSTRPKGPRGGLSRRAALMPASMPIPAPHPRHIGFALLTCGVPPCRSFTKPEPGCRDPLVRKVAVLHLPGAPQTVLPCFDLPPPLPSVMTSVAGGSIAVQDQKMAGPGAGLCPAVTHITVRLKCTFQSIILLLNLRVGDAQEPCQHYNGVFDRFAAASKGNVWKAGRMKAPVETAASAAIKQSIRGPSIGSCTAQERPRFNDEVKERSKANTVLPTVSKGKGEVLSHGAAFEPSARFERLMIPESLRSVLRLVKGMLVQCAYINASPNCMVTLSQICLQGVDVGFWQ